MTGDLSITRGAPWFVLDSLWLHKDNMLLQSYQEQEEGL